MDYRHSVSLDLDKCKGCTHCLRRCPTEAIRIRDGHAVINALPVSYTHLTLPTICSV